MKNKIQFSKIVVIFVMILVGAFLAFICYEMHRQENLEPISVVGGAVVGLLASVVTFYMWRAKQSDMYNLEMAKIKEKSKLRAKYGENFVNETLEDDGEFMG